MRQNCYKKEKYAFVQAAESNIRILISAGVRLRCPVPKEW